MARADLYKSLEERKREYLEYRGASFDQEGNLSWCKEELETWAEGFDEAVKIVKNFL